MGNGTAQEVTISIHHHDLKKLFLEALPLPPAERARHLLVACDDPELRNEVAALLSLDGAQGDVFDLVADEPGGERNQPLPLLDLPERIADCTIEGVLGRGGMGVVYRAVSADGKKVALKILPESGPGSNARKRLEREGEALRRLEHSGIAQFYAAGTFDDSAGRSLPYVAMELIEGRRVRDFMAEQPDRRTAALDLLIELAEALDHAHTRGIIHRDLKPDNLLVDQDGHLKILDFGVARLEDPEIDGQTLMTRVGQLIGTPQYMSPEQAQATGDPVDGRSDLYSLGVIGYELLAGCLPYIVPGDSLHRAVVSILTAEASPLSSHDRQLGGDLEKVIARCLEKKPANRHATARELADDLKRIRDGKAVKLPRIHREPSRSRRGVLIGVAAVALIVVGLFAAQQMKLIPPLFASPDDTFRILEPDLMAANDLLHAGGSRTREDIQTAITRLENAATRLSELPHPTYAGYIETFIQWRLGEAHYFLGMMDRNKKELFMAMNAWERVFIARWNARDLVKMIPEHRITTDIRRLGRHQPNAAIGMVALAQAEYENPAQRLFEAQDNYERSLDFYMRTSPPNYDPLCPPSMEIQKTDLGIILHGLASSTAELGRLNGDVSTLNKALDFYARADSSWGPKVDRPPAASLLLGYGRAFRYRAELIGSQADVDSGQIKLSEALSLRTPADSPAAHARIRLEMSRLGRVAAELVGNARKRGLLDQCRREVTECRRVLGPDGDAAVLADVAEEEAQLLCTIARDVRTSGQPARVDGRMIPSLELLERADSLVSGALEVFTASAYPIRQPELELLRGEIKVERARVTGTARDRQVAADLLKTTLEQVPESQNPRLFAAIRRVLETLAASEPAHVRG